MAHRRSRPPPGHGRGLLLLKHWPVRPRTVLDAGCGKGLFTGFLAEALVAEIHACDVSETAVAQARQRLDSPRLHFFAFDLNRYEELPFDNKTFDLIVLAQTVWCVLPNLESILNRFRSLLTDVGAIMVSQNFLPPGKQQYGREIVAGPGDLLAMLERTGFRVLNTLETNRRTNHHLAVLAEASTGEAE